MGLTTVEDEELGQLQIPALLVKKCVALKV